MPQNRAMRMWRDTLAFVAAFVALDWVSFFHPMSGLDITPWNPQAALAVAYLLRWPRAVLAVAVAIMCADRIVRPGTGWGESAVTAALQTLAYVLVRAAFVRWVGARPQLATRAEFLRFLAVIGGGALVSALLHVAGLRVVVR